MATMAHLNDLDARALRIELILRGIEVPSAGSARALREVLRSSMPGYIENAWPRSVRSLASELEISSPSHQIAAVPIQATVVEEGGLEGLMDQQLEPVRVAASCPGNPVASWPATKAWSPARRFFDRFGDENISLREPQSVIRQGGLPVEAVRALRDVASAMLEARGSPNDDTGGSHDFGGIGDDGGIDHEVGAIGFSTRRDSLYLAIMAHDVPLAQTAAARSSDDAAALRAQSMHPVCLGYFTNQISEKPALPACWVLGRAVWSRKGGWGSSLLG